MNTKPAMLLLLLLAGPAQAQPNDPVQHYRDRVADFEAENRDDLEPGVRHVVLVGDSMIEGWNDRRIDSYLPSVAERVLNRGIVSDRVGPPRGVLSRMDSSIFDTRPSHVVLLVGVNQIGRDGSGVDGAARQYRQVLDQIKARLPNVPVIVVTVPPTRGGYDALNPHIRRFNDLIKGHARALRHPVLDLHARLAGPDGRLRRDLSVDGLHFNTRGYSLFGQDLERLIPSSAGATGGSSAPVIPRGMSEAPASRGAAGRLGDGF